MKFLENILAELKRSGIVRSQRGAEVATGWPGRPTRSRSPTSSGPSRVRSPTCAACDPSRSSFGDGLETLQRMWVALRANLRAVLEQVTLADLRDGRLPREVEALADDPASWAVH